MFAETYFGDILAHCKNENDYGGLKFKCDILNLYENYIKSLVEHFYKEKLKLDWNAFPDDPKGRYIREKVRDIPELACSFVVPNLSNYIRGCVRDDAFAASMDDLGLITDSRRSAHSFLHKKIAEYLAAKFIVEDFLTQSFIDSKSEEILMSVLTNEVYDVLRKFIDAFLGDCVLPKFFENVVFKFRGNNGVESPLHVAASEGNNKLLKALLQRNNSLIDNQMEKGETALHLSCLGGNKECVKTLLNNKCNVNVCDNKGDTSFHLAAQKGETEIMQMLYDRESSLINLRNICGQTPLHKACCRGEANAVEWLLSKDSSVTDIDIAGGNNVLHFAAWYERIGILNLLLEHDRTLLNSRNKKGQTPLFIACREAKSNVAIFLLNQNCDVDVPDDDGDTAFHLASGKGQISVMEKLFERNNELINMQNKRMQTPLHYACLVNQTEAVKFLLQHSCEVVALNDLGNTALHCAASKNHIEAMEILLDYNKSLLDVANKCGETALHLACKEGKLEASHFLLSCGCSFNIIDNYSNTAFYLAAGNDLICIMQDLLDRDASLLNKPNNKLLTPLHMACSRGKVNTVEYLLGCQCSTHVRDRCGHTAFYLAVGAKENSILIMQLLLEQNKSLIDIPNKDGFTPLHKAASKGNLIALQFLLKQGSSTKSSTKYGDTAFNTAALRNNVKAMKLLLQHDKTLLNAANKRGETPLHQACREGNAEAVIFLLAIDECLKTVCNCDSETAYDVAVNKGHVELQDLFLIRPIGLL